MLINAQTLKGYKLNALDGEIGSVKEFYFDDNYWTIRYVVVNTGSWLTGRHVLISPYFLSNVNHNEKLVDVNLDKNEIENSPSVEEDRPVSRQFETEYFRYYGMPMYWAGPYMWGPSPHITRDRQSWRTDVQQDATWDPNLRSTKDVTGHNIQATDNEIGHVEDFIVDSEDWAIRYLVIDTKNWWIGKNVLVSPQWIERISWDQMKVFVNLSRDTIKNAPEYVKDQQITRDYESRLYQYYNRKGYWVQEPASSIYHQ